VHRLGGEVEAGVPIVIAHRDISAFLDLTEGHALAGANS
jgi:hypothetical protein